MKYIFLSLLALVITGSVYGQITISDTPHCHSLVLHADVTGGILPISSGITADDNWSGVIPIGFTYNFYGAPNSSCIIGSNGCLGFDLANALAFNTWPIGAPLLTTTATDIVNCICGPWCDVFIPSGGTIKYSTQGVAPFRNFAVTWCGTAMYSCTSEWLTTQIVIYETTGIAEVHIGHRTICLTGWNGQHAICGVKDPTGTIATTAPGRDFPTVWAATDEAWRYTPSGTTYTVAPIPYAPIPYAASAVYWYDSTSGAYIDSGTNLTIVPTVPGTYTAAVLGCDDTTFAYIHVTAADIHFINSCFEAYANSPCVGDSLKLWLTGDSSIYTFLWTGPGGFTSTNTTINIVPATFADSGMYHLYKFHGSAVDTDSVYVNIHPLPVINATSNAPLCVGAVDTLRLNVGPDSLGETFFWSGPAGFTSTLDSPTVNGFGFPNVGTYSVLGTTVWGCKNTGSVYAANVPPPPPPLFSALPYYCFGDPFEPFTAIGSDVMYYTSPTGVGSSTPPTVPTSTPGTYTFYATQQLGSCISPMDSTTITVFPLNDPAFSFLINRGCSSDTVTVINTTTSTASDYYTWDFGDGRGSIEDSTTALLTHTHVYNAQGVYNVKLTGHNGGVCGVTDSMIVDTRHAITHSFSPTPDTICSGPLNLVTFVNNSSTSIGAGGGAMIVDTEFSAYSWDFGDGGIDTVRTPSHPYTAPGKYTATLILTDTIGCKDTSQLFVYSVQLFVNSFTDTTLCLGLPLPMANTWYSIPAFIDTPNFAWDPSASNNLSALNVQIPFLTGVGTFIDTLTITMPRIFGVQQGCPVSDIITVHSVASNPVTALTASATISYGSSIQLNASNEMTYYWTPDNGTLSNPNINNPIATPSVTTTYVVRGYDVYGCLALDSVIIHVDSSENGIVPSAFTPNNDGLNDIFRIPPPPFGNKFDKMVEFRVFNRWGELVFNTNNRNAGWDGTYHGVAQDMGEYYYEIIVATPGGENVTYKGTVTLIR